MQIKLPTSIFEAALAATDSEELKADKASQFELSGGLARSPRFMIVRGERLDKKTLRKLHELTKEKESEYSNAIEFLYNAIKNPSGILIKKMADVHPGLTKYLASEGDKGKRYLFRRGAFKAVLPYLIHSVESTRVDVRYHRERAVESVLVQLMYAEGTEAKSDSFTIGPGKLSSIFEDAGIDHKPVYQSYKYDKEIYEYQADAVSEVGVSMETFLQHFSFYLETPELHELYDRQMEKYYTFIKRYGQQFRVRGEGESYGRGYYWNTGTQSMLVDGKPARCIMNTIPSALFADSEHHDEVENKPHSRKRIFSSSRQRYYDEEGQEQEADEGRIPSDPIEVKEAFKELTPELLHITVKVKFGHPTEKEEQAPIHPKLRIYHLEKQGDYWVHVQNLATYAYRDDIQKELVIPEEVKTLVSMLVAASAEEAEDVVENKSQATIITCIGDPGLGKTLMAEVMSEECRKPLYKVQAAQLGLDAASLEKNLRVILDKAQRWNALLMIDEANAYIHARGSDVKQNAIVGVFLRLLEYYRGVLILSTNMTTKEGTLDFDIDDAILSRSSVVIEFTIPTKEEATEIWRKQARLLKVNYKEGDKSVVNLTKEMVDELTTRYQISGRSIRNLLKLTWPWSKKLNQPLSLEHFETCIKWTPMGRSEVIKRKAAAEAKALLAKKVKPEEQKVPA